MIKGCETLDTIIIHHYRESAKSGRKNQRLGSHFTQLVALSYLRIITYLRIARKRASFLAKQSGACYLSKRIFWNRHAESALRERAFLVKQAHLSTLSLVQSRFACLPGRARPRARHATARNGPKAPRAQEHARPNRHADLRTPEIMLLSAPVFPAVRITRGRRGALPRPVARERRT